MRCSITSAKKLRKLERQTGLEIVKAMTRGGTNHRIDILDKNGDSYTLHRDGILIKDDKCMMGA